MKILFVAMSESIHTVRWVRQVKNQGWDLYLFPTYDDHGVHNGLHGITMCIPFFSAFTWFEKKGLGKYFRFLYSKIAGYKAKRTPDYYSKRLRRYINTIKPDMVHSLETQGAGYLVSGVYTDFLGANHRPFWLHTLWGSDIYLFSQLSAHKDKLRKVMESCNFISVDCKRDKRLLESWGFSEKLMPIEHATSGFDIDKLRHIRETGLQKTSQRKQIMLKGYQGWSGRCLVAIRALSRCKDILDGYTVAVYSNTNSIDIQISLELFSNETGVPVIYIPEGSSHSTILDNQGISRFSIGLGISDGVPNSVLEAMAMGSFPIQSITSAADEWIEDGKTGYLVPPEDPEQVEIALRRALSDDDLVDNAAEINWQRICQGADFNQLSKEAIAYYNYIYVHFIKNNRAPKN